MDPGRLDTSTPFCNSTLGAHNVAVAHVEWHTWCVCITHTLTGSLQITLIRSLPHTDHYEKVVFAWSTFGVPGSSRAMSVTNIDCIIRSHSMDNTQVYTPCAMKHTVKNTCQSIQFATMCEGIRFATHGLLYIAILVPGLLS